ncbi:MAG: hypothetical protein AB1505_12150 [Candidatus Latescibacterota bacterium]
MGHASRFTLRAHGGVCAGEQWIYDHDEPLARLQHATVEQPEQNLRYFDRILNPVELRSLRLAPGQRPLLAGVQLYWKMGPVITTELVSIAVAGQDSGELTLTVVTRDPGAVATSRRVLVLRQDEETGTYVYDFACHLEIHSPEVFDTPQARRGADYLRFEYCDPWYTDVPAPSVAFPGMWAKRYSHLLAEPASGGVWQMPLNHLATGIPSPQAFRPDGMLVLAYEAGHNPGIEFPDPTAARTAIAVCNWGYDVHLLARYAFDELRAPLCERFRVRLCPDARAQALAQRAAPVPRIEHAGFTTLPLYERRSSFACPLDLSRPAPGRTDAWPWLPEGDGASWCTDEGRSDSFSLQIAKDTQGPTEWTMDREGEGAWTQGWTPSIRFRVGVWVRTRDVRGPGAFLALRWVIYNYPERCAYVCSHKLVGTHAWTRLEACLEGPPPPGHSGVCLILRQDGAGTTWFDDLEVAVDQGE